jgi:UDPglucose 6-dehydrogenase
MKEIYEPFNAPIIVTDINSAELIKHAANSFLALKISYINAIATVCEAAGANVQEVAHGIGLDERIGRRFLNAGIGFGGSCFPKDLSAFIKISEQSATISACSRKSSASTPTRWSALSKKSPTRSGC